MNLFGKWKDRATEYFDVRVQLVKLKFIQSASNVLSSLMFGFILLMVSISVLIFMGLGIMEVFTHLFDSRIWGAFSTAGTFLILMLLLFAIRKSIMRSFAGIFIRIMTDPGDDDEEDKDDRNN
jgi:uncharacterized membrane protein